MKNKTLKFITILISIFALGFVSPIFFARIAYAIELDDLIAIFTPNPLFNQANFAPGQSVSGFIEIKNKSNATKNIITQAINENDSGNFAPALNLEIKQSATTLYGAAKSKTLKNFFEDNEVLLSSLSNNVTTTYEFIITFQNNAGNDYQNKKLDNFDILVGFRGEEEGESAVIVNGINNGGGGTSSGLTISQESARTTTSDNSVDITWLTSYNSTSRVIYAAKGEAHTFDLSSSPNYGYLNSTIEDSNMVTGHEVTINGLISDTIYYYRVISHASPDTVGQELSFTTTGAPPNILKKEEITTPIPEIPTATSTPPISGAVQSGTGEVAGEQEKSSGQEGSTQEHGANIENGKINGASSETKNKWVIILILLLILIALYYFVLKNKLKN
ncbi:fibronectin type III domain-containing protein [Patescibacteria group bacterium]|nr:fibronectin type III domain-containing protein [Patescibacteria group bacterium]